MDVNADEEGEAREGGDLREDEELVGRGGDDTVDEADGCCRGEGADIEQMPRRPLPRSLLIYH